MMNGDYLLSSFLLLAKPSPCLMIQNRSISSAFLPGTLPAIKAHLSPTSLYILKMRSSSCSVMFMNSHSMLLTSSEQQVCVLVIFRWRLCMILRQRYQTEQDNAKKHKGHLSVEEDGLKENRSHNRWCKWYRKEELESKCNEEGIKSRQSMWLSFSLETERRRKLCGF